MTTSEFLRRRSRMAATTLLVAAMVAATLVTRSAAGESPAGTLITHVSVEYRDDDSSVIVVAFDGPITGHRWSHIYDEEPRAVVRIAGIVEAYRPYEVAVEDGRVHRVRIGHHPEFNPPEEHLVFDLVDNLVAITRVAKQDQHLIVVLQRVEASAGSRPPTPIAPVPTAPVPRTVTATPTPTPTPTATATTTTTTTTMTPTATAPLATPTPQAAAPRTATPTSPVSPKLAHAPPPTLPTNPPRVAPPDPPVTTIPHPSRTFSGSLLTELVISHREDGSALVRVTADGPIEGTDVRFFGVNVPPPRNLLVLPAAGLPGEDALLPVRDGLLCEIGVAFIQDDGPARTELTFYLASSDVTFEQAAVKGAHAVILLRPPTDPQTPLGCDVESRVRSRSWRFIAAGPPQEAPLGAD